MAGRSARSSLVAGRKTLVFATQTRFLVAFLYLGTAFLLETTRIENSNVAQQFALLGNIGQVAHFVTVYFLLICCLAVAPCITPKAPDLMSYPLGWLVLLSPLGIYTAFAVASAAVDGTLLPVWWISWIVILLLRLFIRGGR